MFYRDHYTLSKDLKVSTFFPFIPPLIAWVWSGFLSFFILSFLPFTHLPPSSPTTHLLPPLSFDSDVLGTYALLATKQWSPSFSLPFSSHFIHHLLIHRLSACLLACLPVSFSVPHTSVWQPVVFNKKKRITKLNREQIRGRAAGRLVAAFQLWASREGSWYFPYCSHLYVVTYCPRTICVQSYTWIPMDSLCRSFSLSVVSAVNSRISKSPSLCWG